MTLSDFTSFFGALDGLQPWARIVVMVSFSAIIVAFGCGHIKPNEDSTVTPTITNNQHSTFIEDKTVNHNSGISTKDGYGQNYQGNGGIVAGDNATFNFTSGATISKRQERSAFGDEDEIRKVVVGKTRGEIAKTYGKADGVTKFGPFEKWKYAKAVSHPYTDSLTDLHITIDFASGKATSIQAINIR